MVVKRLEKIVSYAGDSFREFSGIIYTRFKTAIKQLKRYEQLKELSNSSLTLVEVGSIGSYVLHSIVQAGVGKIRVVDNDIVKNENVELGFYYKESIGKSRIEVLKERFNHLAVDTSFEWHNSSVTDMQVDEVLKGSDVVVLCSDTISPSQHNYLNEICINDDKVWLSARFCGDSGELGPLVIPHRTACYMCYEYRLLSNKEPRVAIKELLETGERLKKKTHDLNMFMRIIGGYASLEVVKMLTKTEIPVSIGKVLSIDFNDYSNTHHRVLRVPNCPVCGR